MFLHFRNVLSSICISVSQLQMISLISVCCLSFTLCTSFDQERPPTSSMMLSSKKSDAGSSSSSSSSSSSGATGGERVLVSDAMSGPSASSAGPMDVKKKERSSPSGEAGGPPLPHQAGPAGVDPDSAEVRRTSRRKRAKVINLKLTFPPLESELSQHYEDVLA